VSVIVILHAREDVREPIHRTLAPALWAALLFAGSVSGHFAVHFALKLSSTTQLPIPIQSRSLERVM
jgi:hypothetical protein